MLSCHYSSCHRSLLEFIKRSSAKLVFFLHLCMSSKQSVRGITCLVIELLSCDLLVSRFHYEGLSRTTPYNNHRRSHKTNSPQPSLARWIPPRLVFLLQMVSEYFSSPLMIEKQVIVKLEEIILTSTSVFIYIYIVVVSTRMTIMGVGLFGLR